MFLSHSFHFTRAHILTSILCCQSDFYPFSSLLQFTSHALMRARDVLHKRCPQPRIIIIIFILVNVCSLFLMNYAEQIDKYLCVYSFYVENDAVEKCRVNQGCQNKLCVALYAEDMRTTTQLHVRNDENSISV